MSGLLEIASIQVPRSLALDAHAHLQRVGMQGLEGLALWAGVREGDAFDVRATLIPKQVGLRLEHGVSVTVRAEELHRLNVWLYEQQMTLVAQLHSHPTDAYHSDTDDAYPIATAIGSLSIVVPDFARQPFSLARCAVYRLMPRSGWTRLSAAEASQLVSIVD